jgi:hypothetical protein
MTEIDKAIDELMAARASKDRMLAEYRDHVASLSSEIGLIDAELRGLHRTKELWAPAEKAGRLDVQGPVMAMFISLGSPLEEKTIVTGTDLPAAAVHKFLLRAVRDGKLVCKDGVYSLPAQKAAAE